MRRTLEYFTGLLGSDHNRKEPKQLQTVELKVRMDCEGCELRVRKALSSIEGVETVDINMKQQRVAVTGYMAPNKVLKKAQSIVKTAEMWPYVAYSRGTHPYTGLSYDDRAPPGYIMNVEAEVGAPPTQASRGEDQITNLFSDENPNACSIM